MLNFLRKIRRNNMNGKYLKYAFGEIILVVFGILIALSINNWNDKRKQRIIEQEILKDLAFEIQRDIKGLEEQISIASIRKQDFLECLNILKDDEKNDRDEFMEHFQGIATYIDYIVNRTTFNSITASRSIDFIQNKTIVDTLNAFYNRDYQSWGTANRDYTRNVIVPYLMNFDYTPLNDYSKMENYQGLSNDDFSTIDVTQFEVPVKTLQDYKENIFIINLLRQKLFLAEGQKKLFEDLKLTMERLTQQLKAEIDYSENLVATTVN